MNFKTPAAKELFVVCQFCFDGENIDADLFPSLLSYFISLIFKNIFRGSKTHRGCWNTSMSLALSKVSYWCFNIKQILSRTLCLLTFKP